MRDAAKGLQLCRQMQQLKGPATATQRSRQTGGAQHLPWRCRSRRKRPAEAMTGPQRLIMRQFSSEAAVLFAGIVEAPLGALVTHCKRCVSQPKGAMLALAVPPSQTTTWQWLNLGGYRADAAS